MRHLILVCGLLFTLPAQAGLPFFGCERGSTSPRPAWVSEPDSYREAGFYVSVGSAEKAGRSVEEQRAAAEADAFRHLAQQLKVEVVAVDEHRVKLKNGELEQSGASDVALKSKAVFRGLKFKAHWVDAERCTDYTLALVSETSVAQGLREEAMQDNFMQFKQKLSAGENLVATPDVAERRNYLEQAQVLFNALDFKWLPQDAASQPLYAKQLREALAALEQQSASGRVAVFALQESGRVDETIMVELMNAFKQEGKNRERLPEKCTELQDCLTAAKERGFAQLLLLKVKTSATVQNALGVYKGRLTVNKTLYDLASRRVVNGQQGESTVIAISIDELDWLTAIKKLMEKMQ